MKDENAAEVALSPHKVAVAAFFDRVAPHRERWIRKNSAYYADDRRFMRFVVPPGARILELGCGTGNLLASLAPSRGVGVDLSARMVDMARASHPQFEFHVGDVENRAVLDRLGGPFDIIILSDTIGWLDDCETTLAALRDLCTTETRLVLAYCSALWEPILRLGEAIGLRMPQGDLNLLSTRDIENLLFLAGFQTIKQEWRQLVPRRLLGLGTLVNRWIAPLPLIRQLCLRYYLVARLAPTPWPAGRPLPSASVIVPARNEQGNIAPLLARLPDFCPDLEIIIVEGNSRDETLAEAQRLAAANPQRDIKVLQQDGKGKGDAVRKGFAVARGDILMILDADMTVAPEDMGRFYKVLVSGKGEFVNGTRLVYPMEKGAMRLLNWVANRSFSAVFSWLLNDRFTDTLCGTKALWRRDWKRIEAGRSYFGEFDPFGDFDLIFGAAKLSLDIVEVPVRYAARSYGETQISRFRHGVILLRMVVFAWRRLKAL